MKMRSSTLVVAGAAAKNTATAQAATFPVEGAYVQFHSGSTLAGLQVPIPFLDHAAQRRWYEARSREKLKFKQESLLPLLSRCLDP